MDPPTLTVEERVTALEHTVTDLVGLIARLVRLIEQDDAIARMKRDGVF